MIGKTRLAEVAVAAGVSLSTASRVLSGRGPASAAVRDRVAAAATELGYVPHAAGRALATGRGTRLAVVVNGRTEQVLRDPYVNRVVAAAAEVAAAREAGVSMHWLPWHAPSALTRLADDPGIGGMLLLNPTESVLLAAPRSLRRRVAAIGVGNRLVPSFDIDNDPATGRLLAHLLDAGRRRPAMITGADWLPCTHRPRSAYLRTAQEAGFPPRVVPGDFTAARGAAAATEILHRWPDTDAVFALGDLAALGALGALQRAGVTVPGDVAVAGFDDLDFAALSTPALTTTTHPVETIATAAATAVLDRRLTRPSTLYSSELVRRDTT